MFASLVMALSLAAAGAAQASTLVNGSFELPGGEQVRNPLSDGDTSVTGWTVHGLGQYYESDGSDGINASDGHHWVAFGHSSNYGGSITQTFASVFGATYTLDYDFRLQQGYDTNSGFLIAASTGDSVLSGDADNVAWKSGPSLIFTGTGGNITITITDNTAAGHGEASNLALDNVRLTAPDAGGAVPEPAAWALMLTGFAGMGATLRMRRRQAAAG